MNDLKAPTRWGDDPDADEELRADLAHAAAAAAVGIDYAAVLLEIRAAIAEQQTERLLLRVAASGSGRHRSG
jgi:hypothetical protein